MTPPTTLEASHATSGRGSGAPLRSLSHSSPPLPLPYLLPLRQWFGRLLSGGSQEANARAALYREVHVPLPQTPLVFHAWMRPTNAIAAVNRYFEESIGGYPQSIAAQLLRMYHHNKDVTVRPGLVQDTGQLAACDEGPSVLIEATLSTCPLIMQLLKITQIAVHAGQLLQQQARHSPQGYLKRPSRDEHATFLRFTDLSAALLEYPLYRAIPQPILWRDLGSCPRRGLATEVLASFMLWKNTPFEAYSRLSRRGGMRLNPVSQEEHQLFYSRGDVAAFVVKWSEQLCIGNGGSPTQARASASNERGRCL